LQLAPQCTLFLSTHDTIQLSFSAVLNAVLDGFVHKNSFIITFTMFTCQATVCKNKTARSDVIVPFDLHVWKSFMWQTHQ